MKSKLQPNLLIKAVLFLLIPFFGNSQKTFKLQFSKVISSVSSLGEESNKRTIHDLKNKVNAFWIQYEDADVLFLDDKKFEAFINIQLLEKSDSTMMFTSRYLNKNFVSNIMICNDESGITNMVVKIDSTTLMLYELESITEDLIQKDLRTNLTVKMSKLLKNIETNAIPLQKSSYTNYDYFNFKDLIQYSYANRKNNIKKNSLGFTNVLIPNIKFKKSGLDDLLDYGIECYSNGFNTKALEAFNNALIIDSNNIDGLFLRAKAKMFLKDNLGAIEDYSKYISIVPTSDDALYLRANLYLTMDEFKNALRDINNAIKINQNNSTYYRFKGLIYFMARDYLNTLQYINKSIELNNEDAISFHLRAKTYYFLDKNDLACRDYKIAKEGGKSDNELEKLCK